VISSVEVKRNWTATAAGLRRPTLAATTTAILALSAFFHFFRLALVPGWDPEEGYNLDIAWNLGHGRLRLFALSSAFAQHPPLFYLQLAAAIHFVGYDISAIRLLAAAYAVLTDAALFFVGRRLVGTGAAIWSMLVYTVAPVILANTRWGYSYAELALVGLLCLGAAWHFRETRDRKWLWLSAVLAGLATFSDYEGIAWVAFVALVALAESSNPHRWRDSAIALGIGLGLPLFGLLIALVLAPGVLLADLAATLGRAAGGNPALQLILLLLNYSQFLSLDAWLLLGFVGLFLAPARVRGFLLGAAAVLAVVVLKVREIGLSLHTVVPLLPILALGAGIAIDAGLPLLYRWLLEWITGLFGGSEQRRFARMLAAVVVFTAIVSPVAMVMASDAAGLATTLQTRQDMLLGTPADAQAVARYVFSHAASGDLVLASPELAWMFDSPDRSPRTRGADILQTLAQSGLSASFYPAGLPPSRWEFNVSLAHARYVVVDNLLRKLAMPGQLPALQLLLRQAESWPRVFSRGQYVVYSQPPSAIGQEPAGSGSS
jgi:4-amino-4-deoxy-L-arabinose transferase-like glycosyltransferase